jgi:uncharacterized protein YfaP (DUF2135 family)
VTVRDAVTNAVVVDSEVVASHLNLSYSAMVGTDDQGVARIMVTQPGRYKLTVTNTGYLVSTGRAWVGEDSGYVARTTVTASEVLPADSVRMILNWHENPLDLDLHVVQVNKNDKTDTCRTSPSSRTGCSGVEMDQDNSRGGLNGAETITFSNISTANSHYTYLVFVDDLSTEGRSLQESEAQLMLTDGTETVAVDLPDVTWDGSSRFWFVGCLIMEENRGWRIQKEDRFTVDDPGTAETFFCHDLVAPTEPPPPPFWPGAEVTIAVKNGLNNSIVTGATVTLFLRTTTGGDGQVSLSRVGSASSNSQGLVSFPIYSSGLYSVEVTRQGYIIDKTTFTINCNVTDGAGCTPTRLVSLSPLLPRGDLRVMMNWDELPSDLDIYSVQVETDSLATCTTNYQDKQGCRGASLDLDNTRGGDKGPETITYQGFETASQYIYMIYIDNYSGQAAQFRDSEARLTITDGIETVKVSIDPAGYNNEKYWLAGCLRSNGDGFEWRNVETFEQTSPYPAKKLHCMQVFGLSGR